MPTHGPVPPGAGPVPQGRQRSEHAGGGQTSGNLRRGCHRHTCSGTSSSSHARCTGSSVSPRARPSMVTTTLLPMSLILVAQLVTALPRPTRLAYVPRRTVESLVATSMSFNRYLLSHLNARLSLFIGSVEYDRLLGPDARGALPGQPARPRPLPTHRQFGAVEPERDRAALGGLAPAHQQSPARAKKSRSVTRGVGSVPVLNLAGLRCYSVACQQGAARKPAIRAWLPQTPYRAAVDDHCSNCATTPTASTSGSLPSMPGTPMGQVMRATIDGAKPRSHKRCSKRARLVFDPMSPK